MMANVESFATGPMLAADENQHKSQAILEQVEAFGHVGEQKIQRAQTHDGEDVRGKYGVTSLALTKPKPVAAGESA